MSEFEPKTHDCRGDGSGISPHAVDIEQGWFLRTIAAWVSIVTARDIDSDPDPGIKVSRPEVRLMSASIDENGRGHIALRFPDLAKNDAKLERWQARIQELANQELCRLDHGLYLRETNALKIQVEGNPWIDSKGVCQDERCGGSNGVHALDCCNPSKGGRCY